VARLVVAVLASGRAVYRHPLLHEQRVDIQEAGVGEGLGQLVAQELVQLPNTDIARELSPSLGPARPENSP